jgi:RNA polymerase sigma factor (sigma-70 family)
MWPKDENEKFVIDKELIEKCIKRDRRAQNELYEHCYKKFISTCWRYGNSKEDAIELLNIGFLKIITNLRKYDFGISFEAWSHKVMIHAIIDEYRKSKQYKRYIELSDTIAKYPIAVDENHFATEAMEEIMSKLHQLPPTTSKVFNLYAIDGFKHKEIAKLLSMNENTAMWHYSEAKRMLRSLLIDVKKA